MIKFLIRSFQDFTCVKMFRHKNLSVILEKCGLRREGSNTTIISRKSISCIVSPNNKISRIHLEA